MKFCTNCGQQLPDDAGFCTMCGARADAAASSQDSGCPQPDAVYTPSYDNPPSRKPRAKISGKKLAGIICVVVAVAILLTVILTVFSSGAYISLMPDSVKKLEACEKNIFKTAYDFSEKLAETGGIQSSTNTLSFNRTNLIDDSTTEYILKQLELNFGIERNSNGALICLEPGFSGNTLTSVYLQLSEKSIGICIPDYEKKLFRINSDDLKEILGSDEELNYGAFDSKNIKKTLLNMIGILCGIAHDDNTEITKNVNLSLFGGYDTCKVSLYTIKPTGDDVNEVIRRLIDYIENDKDSYLYSIADSYCALDDGGYSDTSEFFDDLRDSAAEISDFFDERNVTIEIAVKGKDIVMHRIIVENDGIGGGSAYGCFMRRSGNELRFMAFEGDYDESFDRAADNLEYSSVCDIRASFSGNKLAGEGVVRNDRFNETYAELSFELDLASRSPLGIFCGSVELRLIDEDIAISLEVEKDGNTAEHKFKVVCDGDTLSFSIDSTAGSNISLPKDIKEVIMTDEEDIQDFAEDFLYDYIYGELVGQIYNILSGGFDFGW